MTLHSLEIPDEPERLAKFLEDFLAGGNLADLVAELKAVETNRQNELSLAEVLGANRDPFLKSGVSAIPFEQQRLLLAKPDLLFELQELAYMEGGDYWLIKLRRGDAEKAAADAWPSLSQKLDEARLSQPAPARRALVTKRAWLALVTTAAVVLIAGLLNWPGQRTVAWGWNRRGVFEVDLERAAYLNHLADAAKEWFEVTPTSSDQLAERMREFRQGCERLQQARHAPVTAEDRAWLVERCRVWSAKIDELSGNLASGGEVGAIQNQMNEMTTKLIAALRQRAATT